MTDQTPRTEPYRQGDVLLWPDSLLPDRLRKQPTMKVVLLAREQGRLIVAEGEATGHHHAIAEPDAELLTSEATDHLLRVRSAVTLTHEEHGSITIAPGDYHQLPQVEYTPQEIIRVAD